ncbi:LytR/AlgR family response regulator transcription factor [Anaerocolumna xylanovorans]|uniref:LytTr DNA-binding domain-containing protein n=1 Tax=Anaerocolumna xylanovorans DSM 12503 TaxID=1121345 RepID=A0A1M7YGH6_9FIRM|nr:LytTR family DNA-binding domain-containing protein [Anaerocolumna xylanovorans]SHO51744.1 LytTr DNA-binding domain-containing protein [Anaerocolumna xylanovorans DSM 12503]
MNFKYIRQDKSLIIKNNYLLYSINLNDIYYFERLGRKIEVVLYNKHVSFYGSFAELEKVLNKSSFIKCHKSYIVNYKKIFLIDKDEISFKEINDIIIVSQNFKDDLFKLVTQTI